MGPALWNFKPTPRGKLHGDSCPLESTSVDVTVMQRKEPETLQIPEVGIEIPVADLYEDLSFPEENRRKSERQRPDYGRLRPRPKERDKLLMRADACIRARSPLRKPASRG